MQHKKILYFFISLLALGFVFSSMPVMAKSTGASSTQSSRKKSSTSKSTKTKKKTKSTKKKRSDKSRKTTKKTGKVNINTADEKTLTELTGVGPVTARKIVAYRKKHGKFKNVEDLMNVKGIGEKTLQKMKPQLKF